MTQTERDIMRHFRQYHIGVNEMLCFNTTMANSNSPKFQSAMTALIRTGMVVKERHRHAYSLTPDGFTLSMSA
jgi:predicted transcriptional regulator